MSSRTPVTLADIAEAAQVSISTVSRILHQRDGSIKISHATTERVLEVAKRLGYEPNPFAAALRTQKTGVLGIIIRDISDPLLRLLMKALQQAAHRAGFEVLIGHSEQNSEVAERQLQVMQTHWFDGLFLLGNVPGDVVLLQQLALRQTPFVAVACGTQVRAPFVTIDEAYGTRLALRYLQDLGHRRIAFLGDVAHAGVRERLATYEQVVQEQDLFKGEGYIQLCRSKRSEAAICIARLLTLPEPPEAVFCAADLLALGALNEVWRQGRRVPEDLSILGFDDIEEAAESFPALSTIRQPVEEMAQQAVTLLLSLMEKTAGEREILIKPELIQRNSCIARIL